MDTFIKNNTPTAIELLYRMKKIRLVEETFAKRYNEWEMRCPTHLCIGQEAVSAAAGLALRADDFVVSTHRAHGHYLGKGGDLKKMVAEIYGKKTGCSAGKGGSMHLIDRSVGFMGSTAIVGGTIPVGTGLGLSIQINGTSQLSCTFFGDGAVEEGVFYESLNFAALKKLPVLFICENNFYSVYSPLFVRQPENRKIYQMVESIGVKADHGDGNNAVEVYQKILSAAESVREGKGPVFFEFVTYRWREHCGPNYDNDIGYRSQKEFQLWKKKDPVKILESDLLKFQVITGNEIEIMESKINQDIEKAFEYAKKSPFPDSEEAFSQVYKEHKGNPNGQVTDI
ncbi:MAG: thiamine pyrophosphate-dependent dehydrogenase E1 component subunit alpha [Thermodesulfobacteriota bacterium]|nr:thiamine pyrophosphate-dependent dehydrogenase E1 component subunit alpha [Thermodesulfobacteriota bacterium]